MSPIPPKPKRPEWAEIPLDAPRELHMHIDGAARNVRVMFKRRLDLAPTLVDLPFATLKALAARILASEAQNETANTRALIET